MHRTASIFSGLLKLAAASVAFAVPAGAQVAGEVEYDIDAQLLADALNQFALQSDREILFAPDAVPDRRTPGLPAPHRSERASRAPSRDGRAAVARAAARRRRHRARPARAGLARRDQREAQWRADRPRRQDLGSREARVTIGAPDALDLAGGLDASGEPDDGESYDLSVCRPASR